MRPRDLVHVLRPERGPWITASTNRVSRPATMAKHLSLVGMAATLVTLVVIPIMTWPGHNPIQLSVTDDGTRGHSRYFSHPLAMAPDGRESYYLGATKSRGVLSIIDTTSESVTASIPLPGASTYNEIAVTPDGARAYVTGDSAIGVIVVDLRQHTVRATIPTPTAPLAVTIAPDARAYVTLADCDNCTDGHARQLVVIDTVTNTLTATIGLPAATDEVKVAAPGRAYTIGSNELTMVDTASSAVIATIPLPDPPGQAEPEHLVVNHDGTQVYATTRAQQEGINDKIVAIDIATRTITPVTLPVPGWEVDATTYTPDSRHLEIVGHPWYSTKSSEEVLTVDATSNRVTATSPLPPWTVSADAITVVPNSGRAYLYSSGLLALSLDG